MSTRPHTITIDALRHRSFLQQRRRDPVTKQRFSAGDEVVVAARERLVFHLDTWNTLLSGQYNNSAETLAHLPGYADQQEPLNLTRRARQEYPAPNASSRIISDQSGDSRSFRWTGILTGLSIVCVSVLAIYNINARKSLEKDLYRLRSERVSVESKLATMQERSEQEEHTISKLRRREEKYIDSLQRLKPLIESFPFIINKIDVVNKSNGDIIGNRYKYSVNDVRYLTPNISITNYSGPVSTKVKLYHRFIKLDRYGLTLETHSKSPKGYSVLTKLKLPEIQTTETIALTGLGHESEGTYEPGHWQVEVWYAGRCLGTKQFRITE